MAPSKQRPRLARMPDAFLPAALAAFCVLRPGDLSGLKLYVAGLYLSAFSLFAGRATRLAFAELPAIRRVRGSVKSALLLTLSGAAILAGVTRLVGQPEPALYARIAAAALLNIEHIFYEYMYAIGDRRSAAMSRGLTALFTLAGLLLSDGEARWLAVMAALSALSALAVALVMGDGARGRPNTAVLRCAPRAALQTALYPAAALAVVAGFRLNCGPAPFFAGLSLYELCRTPFRRSPPEARPLNRALMIVCAVAALGLVPFATGFFPGEAGFPPSDVPFALGALILASICAFALFGNAGGRENRGASR